MEGKVEIVAQVTDPGPISSGLAGVTIFAEEQGGARRFPLATLPPSGSTYRATWTLPACEGSKDHWYIHVQATDRCERTDGSQVKVKRKKKDCDAATVAERSSQTSLWTSELTVPGGQGQLVVNGTHALFAGSGSSPLSVPVRPGPNRVEATLLSGDGEGGLWRFSLASGRVKAGTLRALAGEPLALGPGMVAFAVSGQPGERLVFTFDHE